MLLTDAEIQELEATVQRLAGEGNALATGLNMRLAECATPTERADVLSRFAELVQQLAPAIMASVQGLAAAIAGVLGPAIQQTLERNAPVFQAIHASMWDAYRDAGMPHGETEDGMLRWFREESEAAAAVERAYQQRLREWASEDLRHHLATGEHLPVPERDEVM